MKMNDLPSELLQQIFTHLDLRSCAAVEMTCHRWREVLKNVPQPPIRLWVSRRKSNFCLYPEPEYDVRRVLDTGWQVYALNKRKAVSFLEKHSRGKTLFLEAIAPEQLVQCLKVVETRWTELEDLQIASEFDDGQLFERVCWSTISDRFTRVWLPHFTEGRTMLFFPSFRRLEAISLYEIDHDTFINELPFRIRTLSVRQLKPYVLERLLEVSNWRLKEFKIENCDLAQFEIICSKMDELVTLNLDLKGWNRNVIMGLSRLKRLRNLSLRCEIKDASEEFLGVIPNLADLRQLHLGARLISPDILRSVTTCCLKLEAFGLTLYYEDDLYPATCAETMQTLPELVKLVNLKILNLDCNVLCKYQFGISPLVEFIRTSSSIRNIDAGPQLEEYLLTVVETMNEKAMENSSELFRLRVRLRRRKLPLVSDNLTIYCL